MKKSYFPKDTNYTVRAIYQSFKIQGARIEISYISGIF